MTRALVHERGIRPEEDVEPDAAKLEQPLLAHPLCWMARQINFMSLVCRLRDDQSPSFPGFIILLGSSIFLICRITSKP